MLCSLLFLYTGSVPALSGFQHSGAVRHGFPSDPLMRKSPSALPSTFPVRTRDVFWATRRQTKAAFGPLPLLAGTYAFFNPIAPLCSLSRRPSCFDHPDACGPEIVFASGDHTAPQSRTQTTVPKPGCATGLIAQAIGHSSVGAEFRCRSRRGTGMQRRVEHSPECRYAHARQNAVQNRRTPITSTCRQLAQYRTEFQRLLWHVPRCWRTGAHHLDSAGITGMSFARGLVCQGARKNVQRRWVHCGRFPAVLLPTPWSVYPRRGF